MALQSALKQEAVMEVDLVHGHIVSVEMMKQRVVRQLPCAS